MTSFRIRNATPADVPEIFAMVCELAEYEKARHEVQSSEELFAEALVLRRSGRVVLDP